MLDILDVCRTGGFKLPFPLKAFADAPADDPDPVPVPAAVVDEQPAPFDDDARPLPIVPGPPLFGTSGGDCEAELDVASDDAFT